MAELTTVHHPPGLLPDPHPVADAFGQVSAKLVHQAEIRTMLVTPLVQYVGAQLASSFPGTACRNQLYGSLHHGLYVPQRSKVNIDVASDGGEREPEHVLHVLTSLLQRDQGACPFLAHPVLLWNRTVTRPLLLTLFWNDVPVHITWRNRTGVAVSELMWRVLATNPYLRLTLLHWKTHLRARGAPELLGPNSGQVSTYALFAMLLQSQDLLDTKQGFSAYETMARNVVTNCLRCVPRLMRTPDPLADRIDLTAHAFLAPDLAPVLQRLPPL